MDARIFRPKKSAMTSGRGKAGKWVLEFTGKGVKRSTDPLMGWTSVDDTAGQIRLTFNTREQAVTYAKRNGLRFKIEDAQARKRLAKSYAENFAFDRKQPWTH